MVVVVKLSIEVFLMALVSLTFPVDRCGSCQPTCHNNDRLGRSQQNSFPYLEFFGHALMPTNHKISPRSQTEEVEANKAEILAT